MDKRNTAHEERTTILANERTYAAWLRTGLAFLITGLAFERILGEFFAIFHVHIIATILIFFSITCFSLAAWRYQHVDARLENTSVFGAPVYLLIFLSLCLIVASLLVLVGLWF